MKRLLSVVLIAVMLLQTAAFAVPTAVENIDAVADILTDAEDVVFENSYYIDEDTNFLYQIVDNKPEILVEEYVLSYYYDSQNGYLYYVVSEQNSIGLYSINTCAEMELEKPIKIFDSNCVDNSELSREVFEGGSTLFADLEKSVSEIVDAAMDVIYRNEGSYGSVNANDNGSMSIGKVQWNANAGRALPLLQTIVKANPSNAENILGTELYNEIVNNPSNYWNNKNRTATADEKTRISNLLVTSEGKAAQDSLAATDISGYVNYAISLGMVSCPAIVYYADLTNQWGYGGAKSQLDIVVDKVGSCDKVSLYALHEVCLDYGPAYASRRNQTFNYCCSLGWNNYGAGVLDSDTIMSFMKQTYEEALAKYSSESFTGYCGDCVGFQLMALGVNKDRHTYHGKDTYDYYAGLSETDGGYSVVKYPADSYTLKEALQSINDNNITGNYTYTVVGFNKGSSSNDGQTYGHTLLIYAIIDNYVYYSECVNIKGTDKTYGKRTIDSFCDGYSDIASTSVEEYDYEGLVLLTTEEIEAETKPISKPSVSIQNCTDTKNVNFANANFTWTAAEGGYGYVISLKNLDTDEHFVSGGKKYNNLNVGYNGSQYFDTLEEDTNYRFAVGVLKADGITAYDESWSELNFKTAKRPTFTSPSANSTVSPENLKISWTNDDDAEYYGVKIKDSSGNVVSGYDEKKVNSNSITVNLEHDETYTVGVYAFLGGQTIWSSTSLVFETEGENIPAVTITAEGTCGNNITWTLDSEWTLTISGDGNMVNYNYASNVPWDSYRSLIKNVVIQYGVTNIAQYAFEDCVSLKNITIPKSVTTIGYKAFYDCDSIKNITIPDGVTTIGSSAFYDCDGINNITIPDGVTTIGSSAFYDCDSIKSITIPDSVTTIGSSAFYNCDGINNITIPDGVTTIDSSAFYDCDSIKNITIPDSVTTIGGSAFGSCDSLTSIIIPDEVVRIESGTFGYCVSLESVEIGESVTYIGSTAFAGCSSLESVVIPENVIYIYDGAFESCISLEDVQIGEGVTSIGKQAFYGCISLKNVKFGENLRSVDSNAFAQCDGLKSIVIPDKVSTIGSYAFRYCDALESIVIPSSVKSIGSYVFEGSQNVTIYGHTGSAAETYANKNKIPFKAIEDTPDVPEEPDDPDTPVIPDEPDEPVEYKATMTLSDVSGRPGDTVKVVVSLKTDEIINTIGIRDITYDTNVLTFAGFSDYEELQSLCQLSQFDESKMAVVAALKEKQIFDGEVCTLNFTINENAGEGDIAVNLASHIKLDGDVIDTEVVPATVSVTLQMLGDMNLNDVVDMNDAILLLQYSMFPDLYPIGYKGSVDFTKDGVVDMNDAILLLQYSMFPDLYPIE